MNCDLFRYETAERDDIGVTTKSSVTMYVAGPFTNPRRLDDSPVEDLGSTILNDFHKMNK